MMRKLRVEEPNLPCHTVRMRIFEELSVFPRLDTGVFLKVARDYGIFSFTPGAEPTGKVDANEATLFDQLAPLYATALKSMHARLPELDEMGLGRGLEAKWSLCGVSTHPEP